MNINPTLATDSYKVSHWCQYPLNTAFVHSYFESRGGLYERTLFFGLQYYLQEALMQRVTWSHLDEAEAFFRDHFGRPLFNRAGWEHIIRVHSGALPLRVRAVPEGTMVPVSNVLLTVENTDPAVPWLTNYVETRLSELWYPITTATLSHQCRNIILQYLVETGDPTLIDFKLHDFGYRGVSSQESAAIGGLAHLVNFKGTDTMAALVAAREYYDCKMAGFSIPAAEHSTITSWGREHEVDAFRNMLTSFPTGLVAVVSDSFNIYEACDKLWGQTLHDEVLQREGQLVIRPDSGEPVEVLTRVLDILGRRFGYKTNQKGYKVLEPHVRVIQGDGVDPAAINRILAALKTNGWSADNLGFGMGGALLQKVNRDTCKFAFKCSNVTLADGTEIEVYKEPFTDPGKNSKRGRLALYRNTKTGEFRTGKPGERTHDEVPMLQTVYQDGNVFNWNTLDEIRARANR